MSCPSAINALRATGNAAGGCATEIGHELCHLLRLKQAADGSIIIGDSHEYSPVQEESVRLEYTDWRINEAILEYGKRMITLPSWDIQLMWNGYYLTHPQQQIYTETIDGAIHIVTGIAGKGMSTGAGFVRWHVEQLLG